MPYSRRYEGLASGITAVFQDAGIPLSLMFMRGSQQRVRSLLEKRADLVTLSAVAAQRESGLGIVRDFGPHAYVETHGIVIRKGADPTDDTLRIAIDREFPDQVKLVRQTFGNTSRPRWVEVSYSQLDRMFTSGEVDATVWNLDEIAQHIDVPIDTITLFGTLAAANDSFRSIGFTTSNTLAPADVPSVNMADANTVDATTRQLGSSLGIDRGQRGADHCTTPRRRLSIGTLSTGLHPGCGRWASSRH